MNDRSSLCLWCRVRLEAEADCELHPLAPVADLTTKAGREMLRDRLWGSREARSRVAQASAAGAIGGGFGGLLALDGCFEAGAWVPGLQANAVGLLALMIITFVGFALYWIIAQALRAFRRPARARPSPIGVSRLSGKVQMVPLSGTVSAAESECAAPLSERSCAAWGVVLTHKESTSFGPVLLRDGYTTGLTVTLDDGRVVRVPGGRCRVAGPTGRHPRGAVAHYLSTSVMPADAGPEAKDFPLFPADDAVEVLVSVGDRVHLCAQLTPADGAYRQNTHFIPGGAVELTVVA